MKPGFPEGGGLLGSDFPEGKHGDIDRAGGQGGDGWGVRFREAVEGEGEGGAFSADHGPDEVGRMVDAAGVEFPRPVCGEEQVALDEEPFERAGLGGLWGGGEGVGETGFREWGAFAAAAVADRIAIGGGGHGGVFVG